jgi:hypothetical protein
MISQIDKNARLSLYASRVITYNGRQWEKEDG